MLVPILRDAALRTAPQDEVGFDALVGFAALMMLRAETMFR
jgi:hypothetical protein